ncbi:MAG: beta-galactosidase [Clostridia bacterium]|nr:beta-galactosidase [Clostridia bacterium]
MKLVCIQARFLPGTVQKEDALLLPAAGGGFSVNEIACARERYLNLTMTVLEEHSMAFELRAYGEGDVKPRVLVRFGLMPRYRTNICLDLNWLDGHILFPGHIPGELKVVCHGSRIERSEIVRAEIISCEAYHDICVRFEDVELSDEPRQAAEAPAEKLVDEMGQYIPKQWTGKMPDTDTMVNAIREQAALPNAYPFANWTQWGGNGEMHFAEGTGYFSKIKKDGRWYLLDPDGCAFFSAGPDCVISRCDGRVDGLEKLLEWVPDDPELVEPMQHDWGEVPRGRGKMVSFERSNLKRAFGDGWYESWKTMVVSQLKNMGMNTMANWSDPALYGRMPYVTSLERFPETQHKIFRDFPDVLSPEYEEDAKKCAQALLARRDDPWMIGYFLRNEPGWAFVDNLIIADEVLRDSENTCCKRGLIAWLQEKYEEIAALNAAWETDFASFDALNTPIAKASDFSKQAQEDLRAFSATLIRAYTAIPSAACREADPNHMILGMRWAWISDPVLASGWECFDVFSINCYAIDPTSAIERVNELKVDLPVMIGEFHFGALDSGLTATGLEAVATQAERGKAYRYYCEHAAAHPMCVGCHYFQCYDQFVLGRFDGENYNIGLFDICLQPYHDMAQAVRNCSERMYAIHAGELPPTEDKPASLPMIAY